MKEIRLTKSFLRNPMNSVYILLVIYLLLEAASWSIGSDIKVARVQEAGGFLKYIGRVSREMLLPELCTLFIVISLLNQIHTWLKLKNVKYKWEAIGRYELKFFPFLLVSFLLFNPVTQSVRYLLEQYQAYSFGDYWNNYILKTLTWHYYFVYLFPVLLIGYIALNISLFQDYLKQRREAQEKAEAEAAEAAQKVLALSETFSPKPTVASPHLSYLKGKSATGELDFPVNEVYYFTVEDRFYYAESLKERYMVSKTLNELETELDPTQFFRIKRDYIVNRQAVLHYSYWENGKYIVNLNTPDQHEIIVPRVRMHEFREWLQGRDASKPEPANLV
jgi:two-component system LytT family response regulator